MVSVASACAGVNSQIGFFLVAVAALALVRGHWFPRFLWLFLGLALVWMLNVLRLVLVMAVGHAFGEGVAIDGFHPYIGLVVFGLGVMAMSLAMPWFGLYTLGNTPTRSARTSTYLAHLGDQVSTLFNARPLAARGLKIAAAACLVGTVVAGVTNSDLSQYRLVASDVGGSRIAPFTSGPARVDSATVYETNQYTWVTQYFGSGATWNRYAYAPHVSAGRASATLTYNRPVIADVIQGTDLGDFQDFGIEACYQFHGYDLSGISSVDLGDGVKAQTVTFRSPRATEDTVALWWVWSVARPDGHQAYERVVLLAPVGNGAAPTPDNAPLKGVGYTGKSASAAATSPTANSAALAEASLLGSQIVQSRVDAAPPVTKTVVKQS